MLKRTILRSIIPLIFSLAVVNASADPATATPSSVPVGRVVISGTVPDEATKAVLLAKLQELYGTGQIVDQISVGGVIAPPNWSAHIPKLINQNLKSIGKGQLAIDGNMISMNGEVGSEAIKQTIINDFSGILNSSYTIKNGLRVTASSQAVVDQTLANRVVEFENGSSQLTQSGKRVLDEMTDTLKKLHVKKIDLIGHTDDTGAWSQNLALSMSRADSVKIYLVAKGLASEIMATTGMGPDQPVMSNSSEEGRKRNRRIEFRVSQ
ncbi:OmpA family protein [soil metagenome]